MFMRGLSAKRRFALRHVVLASSALTMFGALLLSAAFASEPSEAGRNGSDEQPASRRMPWPAPVGHRQPRAADILNSLPKDTFDLRIERLNREAADKLRICRAC